MADPIERAPLVLEGGDLVAANGARYPIVAGIPVLLRADLAPTHRSFARTRKLVGDGQALAACQQAELKRAVLRLVRGTNGQAYRTDSPRAEIPIPVFPERGGGERMLDLGCGWGRWTLSAARAGFASIGLDSSLEALIAAKRLAAAEGIDVAFVCGDARSLPFVGGAFDRLFSYSVLQHFSVADCTQTLSEVARVLRPGGVSIVQMANRAGLRSLWQQARRGFRAPVRSEVRYWSRRALDTVFADAIGPTAVATDCFFGLGLQASDTAHMIPLARAATRASEVLKRLEHGVPVLGRFADSVYCRSVKPPSAT